MEMLTPEHQHVLRTFDAIDSVQNRSTVVSHVSAAAMWGLPIWDLPLDRVHR
ncbi:hypothetical protein AS9A_3846 [Hoyosella subflava DQS3-9A1]|uniref:Uncharacterized protein n=1 Tax=Hoyosella subflava (strain DSM 45089 / JCM 17490 / NBRC 109087 / DQS3-9A1) TaxID=443218 RepID=F6EGP6_HOYSD|nr:hypothetical protein AS9A_3846 [Hoyosella subflava DQS3-9A1]